MPINIIAKGNVVDVKERSVRTFIAVLPLSTQFI